MKKVSKIITMLFGIALFMVSSLYAGTASVGASASKTTLSPGATTTIYVSVSSSSKIRGASFSVTSTGNVEIVSVAGANGFTAANNGSLYSLQNLSGNALKSGSSIATITVRAKSNAANGATGSVSISGSKVSIQDDGNPYTVSGGSRTVNFTISKNTSSSGTGSGTTTTVTKSSDATLKSLTSSVLDLKFDKNKTSYTVYVDKTVNSLGLSATVNNSKATVKIVGDENFQVGTNKITITVKAENGNTKVYTINVIKSAYRKGALKSLEVKIFGLNKAFESDEFEYTVTIPGAYFDTTKLNLAYEAANADATVVVEGNEDFVVGKNTVKITVTEKDGTQAVYTLNVIKEPAVVAETDNSIWVIIIVILAVLIIAETIYIIVKKKKNK